MRFFPSRKKDDLVKISPEELARLQVIEQIAGQMVKLLKDGQVDYDLIEQLKDILDANKRP